MNRNKSGNSIFRAAFVAVCFLLQLGWILLLILRLNEYSVYISAVTGLISVLAVLRLCSRQTNSAYKIAWILLILTLPVMGLSLYLISQVALSPKGVHKRLQGIRRAQRMYLEQDPTVMERLAERDREAVRQFQYLAGTDHRPVWGNTHTRYYGEAADAFEALKADLEQAENFIFLEYFIVEDGAAFRQLREILERKARQGVLVRLLYDDLGSIGKVNWKFVRDLNARGIQCRPFNPALPLLNLFLNNRDHRKIAVIDGRVGYTGGFNLADEYFDITHPYGHWKDTGVRLEGEAVSSLTAIFLELWNLTCGTDEDPAAYLTIRHSVSSDGAVQPFGESPLDGETAAENVFLNMLGSAKEYIWFMTPYLMITDELSRALELAAKRGVDVRIITPGIPDKKTVYAITRSYYPRLVRNGVRIYEYSPGFCHGKQCVCDGKIACIGTSNLDFRSLYLHFENNVLLYDCDAVDQMEADFRETFPLCREVTESYRRVSLRIWQCILRLFAPMM